MPILSIETSADETAVAITEGRKVLSSIIYSQILTHAQWGGIYPSLAKRAHEEKIDPVILEVLKRVNPKHEIQNSKQLSKFEFSNNQNSFEHLNFKYSDIVSDFDIRISNLDYIAVTYGPGLAIALEVGIKKAKELAAKYNKKIIAVNHLEGHIYSCFVQNSKGNPKQDFKFPYLAFIISGGHTEIVLFKNHCTYEILGETLDDAAGEALDKAAKMLGLGYPGGPIIEQLAKQVGNKDYHGFPRPMLKSDNLDFSFSGLKTSFYYFLKRHSGEDPSANGDDSRIRFWTSQNDIRKLASSYQEAVFETLEKKLESAIKKTGINRIVVGGGVSANQYLRTKLRALLKKYKGSILFPPFKYLTGDNAVMIGVAAYYKAQKNMFVKNIDDLDRVPRLSFSHPKGDLASIK